MGKIAKPQKSKKHKKIKFVDPFYHGDRKERMFIGHNLDPTVKDLEQKISRTQKDLLRRVKLTQELKNKSRREKKKIVKNKLKKNVYLHPGQKELLEVPKFEKQPGENYVTFMNRVECTTFNAVKEAQMIASIKLKQMGGDTEDEMKKKLSQKKEKLKMKKQLQQEKKQARLEDRKDDYEKFRDKVEFGETVTAPPILSVRPRHAKVSDKPSLKNLHLYELINKNSEDNTGNSNHIESDTPAGASHSTGKATKRKLLSPAQKQRMDKERQKVIDLYRQTKKKVTS